MTGESTSAWFTGSLIGLQSPGYQLMWAKVDHYEHLLKLFDAAAAEPETTGSEQTGWHTKAGRDYAHNLKAARDSLTNRIWYLVPYPKYDLAWSELSQVRNFLCTHLSLGDLFANIVDEINQDLGYLDKEETDKKRAELEKVRSEMLAISERGDQLTEITLRAQLGAFSQLGALGRQAHWLKVNMTRNRLLIMGILLAVILGISTFVILPKMYNGDESRRFYESILLFGAMGGLISGIMTTESVDTRASEYYINRRLLYLRPIIGAALALVIYFAVEEGLISIANVDSRSSEPTFFVLAFVSGFGERAFVGQLLALAQSGQRATGDDITPAH
jgi:hypothetical protein